MINNIQHDQARAFGRKGRRKLPTIMDHDAMQTIIEGKPRMRTLTIVMLKMALVFLMITGVIEIIATYGNGPIPIIASVVLCSIAITIQFALDHHPDSRLDVEWWRRKFTLALILEVGGFIALYGILVH